LSVFDVFELFLDCPTSSPFKSTSPLNTNFVEFAASFMVFSFRRPLKAFKNVVFPDPDGPRTASNRPARCEPEIWSKMTFGVPVDDFALFSTLARKSHHSNAFIVFVLVL
jgi:hypothetical protein